MRVLSVGNMYPPHHLGGYELVWRSAVQHLRRAGHQVRVLSTDHRLAHPDSSIPEDADLHRELRWYWRDHAFPAMTLRGRLALERHNLSVLERHLRELEPHVVTWWAMGGMSLALIEAVRRRGLAAVGMVHDDWMVYGRRVDAWQRAFDRLRPLAWVGERLSAVPTRVDLGSAAMWLFVSEAVRRRALGSGLRLARTAVVPSGVDLSLFGPGPVAPWRGRLLYVGRLDERKGLEVAIRSLVALPPETTLQVVGAGDDAYLRRLRRIVAETGLDERVRFERKRRDELPATYRDADALLFPVLWEEPWGLVPLEAMATGTPVVATGSGGSGEYLRHGDNCLIFEPRDQPAALAEAVGRLADDTDLRERLRAGGLATARRFDEESFNRAVGTAVEEEAA